MDASNSSGLYRFVPDVNGDLARGGRLCMLKIASTHQNNLTGAFANNAIFDVEWVEIGTRTAGIRCTAREC